MPLMRVQTPHDLQRSAVVPGTEMLETDNKRLIYISHFENSPQKPAESKHHSEADLVHARMGRALEPPAWFCVSTFVVVVCIC